MPASEGHGLTPGPEATAKGLGGPPGEASVGYLYNLGSGAMSRWAGWGAVTSGGVGESSWGDCEHNTGDPIRPGSRESRGEGPRPRPRYLHPRDPPPDGKGLLPMRLHTGSKAFSLETFSQCPPEKEAPRTELCAGQCGPASSWLSRPAPPPSAKTRCGGRTAGSGRQESPPREPTGLLQKR